MAGSSKYTVTKRTYEAPTTSDNVSSNYNKSGIGLTGSMSSGTMTYKKTKTKRPAKLVSKPGSKTYGVTQPTGSGPNIAGLRKVGEGDSTRYVDVPEPYSDRRKPSTTDKPGASTSKDAGVSRPSPAEAKKGLATTLKNANDGEPTGADKGLDKSSGGKMTLNDFMRIAAASGKTNAYRRGYQMYKNYEKTGKLPSRRVSPDK